LLKDERPVHVALDMHHTRQSSAGTARVARSLADALRKRADVEIDEIGGGSLVSAGVRQKLLTAQQDFVWYPWAGRRTASKIGADVYHCPAVRAPLTRGRPPLVVTVHDLVSVHLPETMPRWTRLYSRATLSRMLHAADLIITPSADTANDLHRLAGVAHDRLRTIWNGVSEIFFENAQTDAVVPQPYVLFVGTPEPRKNLQRLAEAVEMIRKRGFRHSLVIAGSYGWGKVKHSASHVHDVGRVNDEQLRSLYSHAACVALVSLHEGFGLPAVEAMACGAPVVASRAGALPEITGGAAVPVDPYDVNSIANGLIAAIEDRERLVAAGKVRAQLFRWSRAAEEHVKVYREVR
jgi:glycosyltransferase involved in cell wall biosynthesis